MNEPQRLLLKERCPRCKEKVDGWTGVTGQEAPKPGDVSVCFACGELLVFVAHELGVGLARATAEEVNALDVENRAVLGRLQRKILAARGIVVITETNERRN